MITHYDLFAGIGGFSLALEEVFPDAPIRHIFCEWEQFPTAVLKRHWPEGEFWGDIAELVAHTNSIGLEKEGPSQPSAGSGRGGPSTADADRPGLERGQRSGSKGRDQGHALGAHDFTIVTGGFPCQPFSAAGRRQGTADDRYQWPNMLEVIRRTAPEWVVAENVRGLVTWNDGLVLETVCTDLEAQGYEVQPFIIPAVAIGAPHRRDRVWIIAHAAGKRNRGGASQERRIQRQELEPGEFQGGEVRGESQGRDSQRQGYPDWARNWAEVAFATCDASMDDGLPRSVDGVRYSRAKWRKESIKAYGNGIVSQVAVEILRGIR